MQSELKACPFCGADPILEEHPPHKHFFVDLPDHPGSATIACAKCSAGMIASTVAEAIAAWNARAEGSDEITQRVQAAINSVDFKDVKSRILREYLKAGARRIIAAINAALKTSTGEGN